MTITKLKGCQRPGCNGALNLTQEDPVCMVCGWVDYGTPETHENRRTATKRRKARASKALAYRVPNRARTGPYAAVPLTVVTPRAASVVSFPLCPRCLTRMSPTWVMKMEPGAQAYKCSLGHALCVHRNKLGDGISWSWFTQRQPYRRGV